MTAGQPLQLPPNLNSVQPDDSAEGGLNLGQLLDTLRRKAILIAGITAAMAMLAAIRALTDTPIYQTGFEILIQSTNAETEIISSIPDTLTNSGTSGSSPRQQLSQGDQLKILTSPKVLLPVVEQLQTAYPNITYGSVAQNLSVTPIGQDSNIVQITYRSQNPEEVEVVADRIVKAYLEYSLESRQADIKRGIAFLEVKLPDLEKRVNLLQEQLQQLRIQNDLIDPESRGSQLSGQVNVFTQQELETQVQLDQARALYSDLRQQLVRQSQESAASSALSQNPRYQALLNQLLELDGQIAEASTLLLENSPDMQVLQEQRQNLLALLEREGQQAQREVIGQIRQLETRQRSLNNTLDSLNANVEDLSGISRSYTDIQRDLQIATENLTQFLAKREALQIEVAQREEPWELITPPFAPQPSTSSLMQNLVLGAILGLLLGTGVALALDKVTDVIHTSEDLKRITQFPLLGIIPSNEEIQTEIESNLNASIEQIGAVMQRDYGAASKNGSSTPHPETLFSEAFRSLYASLQLLNPVKPLRSLVISSATPLEGKSIVAIHLAQAHAAMGKHVLLVDANLRHPKLHDYLQLNNSVGLIDLISGAIGPGKAIQPSQSSPNLHVLTAGSMFLDPTRLLSSQKMQFLMDQLLNTYDVVIYDSPSLLGVTDTYLTAAHTDGIILVAELGKLKRTLLEQALEQLNVLGTPIIGAVARTDKLPSFWQAVSTQPRSLSSDEVELTVESPNFSSN
jgi:polysaccharide biosynthesis transport protein